MELMNIVYEQDWEFARETSDWMWFFFFFLTMIDWMWLVKIIDPAFEDD